MVHLRDEIAAEEDDDGQHGDADSEQDAFHQTSPWSEPAGGDDVVSRPGTLACPTRRVRLRYRCRRVRFQLSSECSVEWMTFVIPKKAATPRIVATTVSMGFTVYLHERIPLGRKNFCWHDIVPVEEGVRLVPGRRLVPLLSWFPSMLAGRASLQSVRRTRSARGPR